jgi:hypothetical protein
MFKDIGQHKIDPRDRAAKLFVLATSTIVFALIIYMPQLELQLVNSSKKTFAQIILEGRFSRGDQFICGGRSYANELEPGEVRRVSVKCVESGFTGAVIYGIGLEDARQGLEYEIVLKTEEISVIALSDTLIFKLL